MFRTRHGRKLQNFSEKVAKYYGRATGPPPLKQTYLCKIRKVYVTPSTMHFMPPEKDLKNRVTM